MCGRFAQTCSTQELKEIIEALGGDVTCLDRPLPPPSWNVAPTHMAGVLLDAGTGPTLHAARWGFPEKDRQPGRLQINARIETLAGNSSPARHISRLRCLVPASGFYEWSQPTRSGYAQPWFFSPGEGTAFLLAGLWMPSDPLPCFVILTEPANETVAPIHGRMPVMLAPPLHRDWLGQPPLPEVLRSHGPCSATFMRAHPVSQHVNNPRHNTPDCTRPVAALEQLDLFGME